MMLLELGRQPQRCWWGRRTGFRLRRGRRRYVHRRRACGPFGMEAQGGNDAGVGSRGELPTITAGMSANYVVELDGAPRRLGEIRIGVVGLTVDADSRLR